MNTADPPLTTNPPLTTGETTTGESATRESAWSAPTATSTEETTGTRTTTPPRSPRRRRGLERRTLHRPWIAAAVVATTWAIAFPGSPLRSLGVAIVLGVTATAAVATARPSARSALLCTSAIALLPWLAIRQSPWLISINIVVFAMLLLSALAPPPADEARASALAFVGRSLTTWRTGLRTPEVVARMIVHDGRATSIPFRRIGRLARGLVIPVIVSALCLSLLASGDALFASYLDLGWLTRSVPGRFGSALLGMSAFFWMISAAHSPHSASTTRGHASPITVLLTLACLGVTIGAYAITQISAALLGDEFVQRRTGLTYADYARSGFFQLVAVAAIAATAVSMARPLVTNNVRVPLTRWLAVTVTIGVLAMVGTSIVKLAVYTDRFGLTMLRLYTIVFAVWIGLVVMLTLIALFRRTQEWLVPVVLATVAIGAFSMNVANPERIVADHNLTRALDGADLDIGYLDRLSVDAAPTILDALDDVDHKQRVALTERWCSSERTDAAGWNRAVSTAKHAQNRNCP